MNKKIALVGIASLLFVASAFALVQETEEEGEGWGFGGMRNGMFGYMAGPKVNEKLGLSEDATREEVKSAMLEDLGLGEDATKEEVRKAMYEKKAAMFEEKMQVIAEKLGLPNTATAEEIHAAMQKWREENRVLCGDCQGKMKGKGFGAGFHGLWP